MDSIKQPYGIRNGKLVSIEQVESGLNCNCFCPACNNRLIARKGLEKQHHFAHYNSDDCGKGIETIIHQLSKEILSKSKTFRTPALKLRNSDIILIEETDIQIDNVRLEYRLENIIPDIIIESKGKELLIEITVTHKLCFPKTGIIEDKGFATIEIFAQDIFDKLYKDGDFFFESNVFQKELVSGTRYKHWIYNKKTEIIQNILKNNYANRLERKTIRFDNSEYLNYIDNCPLNKRIWKSGLKKGQSYAKIEEDCSLCEFCVGMDYKEWIDPGCEFHQHSFPITTYCCGEHKNNFQELIICLRE